QEFLELNVFYDLRNLNTGYDSDMLWHFSADDFRTVMDRAEGLGMQVLGIECWEKEEEKFTKYFEDYRVDKWHRQAYDELLNQHSPCVFTATFDVPAYLLREYPRD